MNTLLCDAIRTRRLIRFVYEGHERIVEPHMHGINRANHEVLSGWLVGGWSESKPEPGWRNYLVRDMHDVHALSDGFDGPRPKYNAFDPQMRQVFCRLAPIGIEQRPEAEPVLADMPPPTEIQPLFEPRGDPGTKSDREPEPPAAA